ncbi:MAG: hypothetical protein R2911_05605 [Caldilineaceae bacterium]
MVAGDMAAAVYAHAEAERSLSPRHWVGQGEPHSAEPSTLEQFHQLYMRLGRILELRSHHDQAIAVYEEMARVGQAGGNQAMVLASLLARAAIRITVNFARNPIEGRALLERARYRSRTERPGRRGRRLVESAHFERLHGRRPL